jgi:CBS domain-containing protein
MMDSTFYEGVKIDDLPGRKAMRTRFVKDLMIPVSEFKTISEEASLYDAALALKTSQKEFEQHQGRPRAIVVREESRVVGIIGQHDLLRALEPRYRDIGLSRKITLSGFSPNFLRSMLEAYKLWDKPLSSLCEKAFNLRVKDFMDFPSEGECIDEDATLDEAIHQLIMGNHDSLFVMRGDDMIGILRQVNVFTEVEKTIESCERPG